MGDPQSTYHSIETLSHFAERKENTVSVRPGLDVMLRLRYKVTIFGNQLGTFSSSWRTCLLFTVNLAASYSLAWCRLREL